MTVLARKGFNEDGTPRIVEVSSERAASREAENAEFAAKKAREEADAPMREAEKLARERRQSIEADWPVVKQLEAIVAMLGTPSDVGEFDKLKAYYDSLSVS